MVRKILCALGFHNHSFKIKCNYCGKRLVKKRDLITKKIRSNKTYYKGYIIMCLDYEYINDLIKNLDKRVIETLDAAIKILEN